MIIRLFLIIGLIPLQSCSNTLIGEKLENSFDVNENSIGPGKTIEAEVGDKLKEMKKMKSNKKNNKDKKIIKGNIIKNNSTSNKDSFIKKTTKSVKKVTFTPRPYRIILKLSGTNPSAPAETVTEALRKAGVKFEVEKIERFEEKTLLKNSSLKR